jgi:hypothetical protein
LVYGSNAVIPVVIGEPYWKIVYPHLDNGQLLRENLDMDGEIREAARVKEISRKQQVA